MILGSRVRVGYLATTTLVTINQMDRVSATGKPILDTLLGRAN